MGGVVSCSPANVGKSGGGDPSSTGRGYRSLPPGRTWARAARAIRREAKALVVFAEVAVHGIRMPATSNGVERVVGMIADRCKRKRARWGSGLRNLLVMMLARKTRRGVYDLAVRRYLARRVYG